MLDLKIILGGAAVAGVWIAKEIGSLAIREWASRRGKLKFIPDGRYFLKTYRNDDGTESVGATWPIPGQIEEQFITTEFHGNFVNETSRPIILQKIDITFYGVEGARITHSRPSVRINKEGGAVQTLPPNTHTHVTVRTSVNVDELETLYKDTIPILNIETSNGKKYLYELHGAFMGEGNVRWNSKKHRVFRV